MSGCAPRRVWRLALALSTVGLSVAAQEDWTAASPPAGTDATAVPPHRRWVDEDSVGAPERAPAAGGYRVDSLESSARSSPPATIEAFLADARAGRKPPRIPVASSAAAKPANNPLAAYMGAWMTPRDRQLLQPESAKEGPGRIQPRIRTEQALLPSDGAAASNPYLQPPAELETPTKPATRPTAAPEGAVPTHLLGLERPTLAEPLPAASAPTAVPPSAPSGPWRPASDQDQKYFPQLKRF